MNVGIANDAYNTVMAQHFSSDYVRYSQRPSINNDGILTLSANVTRATLDDRKAIPVTIAYDRPPRPLTAGQLANTYGYCAARPVAGIVKTDGGTTARTIGGCVDPYLIPPSRPAPSNAKESDRAWTVAKATRDSASDVSTVSAYIVAETMTVNANSITVKADLSRILDRHGPGIYTVRMWGQPNHMSAPALLSEQAIFWKTRPPSGAPY